MPSGGIKEIVLDWYFRHEKKETVGKRMSRRSYCKNNITLIKVALLKTVSAILLVIRA